MIWLTWRQHRLGVAVFGGIFLIGVGIYLFSDALGTSAHAVYENAFGFARAVKFAEDLSTFLLPLPLLAGMFAGAPLVSRELEHHTFRYAWTQGVRRTQWLRSKVFLLGSVILVLSTSYAAVHMWWFAPLVPDKGWFHIFSQTVPVFPASCLFAFAFGILVGTLLKRTVPGMAVALFGCGAVFIAVSWLRPHYMSPVTHVSRLGGLDVPAGKLGWFVGSQFRDANGNFIDEAPAFDPTDPSASPVEILNVHPPSRFWPFQFIETGIYLALTIACLALTFWWLRRKVS